MIELNKDLITKIDKVHKCISVDRDIQIFSE